MREHGFTLVEAMVAMTVLLFLLIAAVPSLGAFTGNVRLRVASEGMRDGLAVARNEAIRRNATVLYRYAGTAWSIVLPGSNGAAETELVRRADGTNNSVRVAPAMGQIAFSGSGRTFPVGTAMTLQFSNPGAGFCRVEGGEVTCLRVDVPSSGEPRLCDPAAIAGTPRAC